MAFSYRFFLAVFASANAFESFFQPEFRFNETCLDKDNAKVCEDDCIDRFQKCSMMCADQACVNDCKRTSFMCLDSCPCHADCPLGCVDCENWSCGDRCMEPETNPDVDKCHLVADHNLLVCESDCHHDVSCANACVDEYQIDLSLCPCGELCPNGCPCGNSQNSTGSNWECYCASHEGVQESARCKQIVDSVFHECWTECGESDECILDCLHDRNQAYLECPCDLNCPSGCPCDGFDCALLDAETCLDPTTNENVIKCFTLAERRFDSCAEVCLGNATCVHGCSQALDDDIDNCPCSNNCKYDCPCPFFDCGLLDDDESDLESGNILVVYNNKGERPAMFSFSEDPANLESLEYLTEFAFETGTGSLYSCSAMVNGQMMIFGGTGNYINQVSVVQGCDRLSRIGNLPMDFEYGACTPFVVEATNTTSVLLCFPDTNKESLKKCYRYDNGVVTDVVKTKHDHYGVSLGMFKNKAIVVGSGEPKNRKMEEIDTQTMDKWVDMHDFPFVNDFIYGYSMVSFEGALYLFGGGNKNPFDLAARYDGVWANVGPLIHKRWDHRSIAVNNKIIHVGGSPGNQKFELWTWNGYDFIKKDSTSSLNNYIYYPESFAVGNDFCT